MEQSRYSNVAVMLHWAMAILIVSQIAGGLYMHKLPNDSLIKFDLFQLHKSFGLTILVLSFVRLWWRLSHKPPALPAALPNWQRLVARGTHWLFYVLMIVTPLFGWAMVSASTKDIPTVWFGLIEIPHLPFFAGASDREALEDTFGEGHELLAYAILGLLALHIAAALKHGFFNRDGVLRSMAVASNKVWIWLAALFAVLGVASVISATMPSKTGSRAASQVSHHHEDGEAAHDEGNWIVDYDRSGLRFIGEEKSNRFVGKFKEFSATIHFDPMDLTQAHIEVKVDTASAMTGDELRDATMPGTDWFHTREYPFATFISDDIRQVSDDKYEADGVLTVKGFEHSVTVEFGLWIEGDDAIAKGGADLIRTDYGLGEDAGWLEEEKLALAVRIEFEIHATRAD